MTPGVVPHTVRVLLDDGMLPLNRAVGALRRRNLAIGEFSVAPGAVPGVLRLTLTVPADSAAVDRMVNQLRKLSGVREVAAFSSEEGVERELALVRVRPEPGRQAAFLDAVAVYGAEVVEEDGEQSLVQMTGSGPLVLAFLRALEPFGVVEVARSGTVALPRGRLPVHTLQGDGVP